MSEFRSLRGGVFDVEAQRQIVERYERLERVKKTLMDKLEALADMQVVLERPE